MHSAEEIIDFFGMQPLPGEGGYYIETYRAAEKIAQGALPQRYSGDRNFSTAILYLLTVDRFSSLHRVKSDEIFHFYMGTAVTMLQLAPDGSDKVVTLDSDIFAGQQVQVTVPEGSWQGCCLSRAGRFALMGTTVSPGFDFADFETADREQILKQYPMQRDLIIKLTWP
ncbi:MAG: cupin domain-containing protein [Planctomycetota bacterium]|jgi:predicted cupin superfamily sugar epimerase